MKKKLISVFIASFLAFGYYGQQFGPIILTPGTSGSEPGNFKKLNSLLVFTADVSPSSYSIDVFSSDGTLNGTVLLKNNIGTYSNNYKDDSLFVTVGNNLYFKSTQNGLSSVWKTDGTLNGTMMVHDISTETFYGNIVVMNNALFYLTKSIDPVWQTTTVKLWKYDTATNVTTVLYNWNSLSTFSSGGNANLFGDVYYPFLRAYNNKIYFLGWQSDGTNTTQTNVRMPYLRSSCLYNGIIYYPVGNGIGRTDGTSSGTFQVVTDFPFYDGPVIFNGLIYFAGGNVGSGLQGVEFCSSNGTSSGTTIVKDIYFGYNSSQPLEFFALNGLLYFCAYDATSGRELFKSDGTNIGTTILKDINIGLSNSFDTPNTYDYQDYICKIKHNNLLYFNVNSDYYNTSTATINGIWKSDGTTSNTAQVFQIDTTRSLMDVNGKLFFAGYTPNEGWELYAEGLTADINEGSIYSSVKIYPNPTQDFITLQSVDISHQHVEIVDQFGRMILESTIKSAETYFDLGSFMSGIYFLQVEGQNQLLKIIKN